MLEMNETVHVRFRITLRDARGHVLHQKTFGHEYGEPPRTSRRS